MPTTKKDIESWDSKLNALALRYGTSDTTKWLVEYNKLKEAVLEGCPLGRYANGIQIADEIIGSFGGYEYLAVLFAKMKVLDMLLRGIIEGEEE